MSTDTMVNSAEDAIWAIPQERPQYLAEDLRALTAEADTLRIGPHPGWQIELDSAVVRVRSTGQDPGDELSVVRVIAAAVWAADINHRPSAISAGDQVAQQALQRCSLMSESID